MLTHALYAPPMKLRPEWHSFQITRAVGRIQGELLTHAGYHLYRENRFCQLRRAFVGGCSSHAGRFLMGLEDIDESRWPISVLKGRAESIHHDLAAIVILKNARGKRGGV